MRTATITFHASHNYGSMLQAFALQRFLQELGVQNDIINFRSEAQKKFYPEPKTVKGWKAVLRRIVLPVFFKGYNHKITSKYRLFEDFLSNKLKLTPEITSKKDLTNAVKGYDYYITGSDQCWNTNCYDFDWAYYLDFVRSGNRISYASSIGPYLHDSHADTIKSHLEGFKAISVRDNGTQEYVASLTGSVPPVLPDPTLLPERKVWESLAANSPLVDHPYIFLYTPYYRAGIYDVAMKLSDVLGLPVVVSNLTDKKKEIVLSAKGRIEHRLDSGPLEFINLIKNATVVLCGSFHALVFSTIFHKPVWAFNGDKDLRMRQILGHYGLSARSINLDTVSEKAPKTMDIDFTKADRYIEEQRELAREYLTRSLGIE